LVPITEFPAAMGLKADLDSEVSKIFSSRWTTREGKTVPDDQSVKLGNDAVKLKATVLYADLADSTNMVDKRSGAYSAEVYKTFLLSAARIITSHGGTITAYDGDRIMAVYVDSLKNTNAVKSAMKIRYAVDEIINPAKNKQYPDQSSEPVKHVVGIDTSELFVAKTGVRGANDLVWVGRAANYAAKLSALPSSFTYVTREVFDVMTDDVKVSEGKSMWEAVLWNTFDNRTIYRSSWRWRID
jgi:uridylate cyclase